MPRTFCAALKRVMIWIFPQCPFRYKLEPVPNLGKNAQPSKTEVTVPDSQTATGPQSLSSHEILYAEVPNLSKLVTIQPSPIFEGSFSDVYRGTWEGETVRDVRFRLFLSKANLIPQGRCQSYKVRARSARHG